MGTPFASDSSSIPSAHRKKASLYFLAAVWLLAAGFGFVSAARAEAPGEYDLKAVLLFNLTRFVEWPEQAFAKPDAPFIIGILGQDSYGKTLDGVVRTESYGRHKIQVVRFRTIEAVRDCHILFISANEQPNLRRIFRELAGRPILSVGEFDGFATDGGMVCLYPGPGGTIRLRINLGAARAGGLAISGKLLRMAEIKNTGGN